MQSQYNNPYYDPYAYPSSSPSSYPQYQNVPVSQDEMAATLIQEERIRNIISQINPDNQLFEIEMRIKGYRKELNTNSWVKIDNNGKEPSPVLVSRFISYLSSILNQNTSISNISENQINKLMKLVIEYIVDDLDSNAQEYSLESSYTERTRIGHIILNSVFMVLNRALNGQEARRMWGTLSLTESSMGGEGGYKKPGLMEALKFWK